MLPVCITFLQVVLSILQSGLKVSLLHKWIFLALQPHSPFLCRALVIVFFETTVPDMAKSFTSVWAVVLGSLDTSLTSFLSRVFEIFHFLPLPGLFCTVWLSLNFLMILVTPVLDTWKHCDDFVYPSPAL